MPRPADFLGGQVVREGLSLSAHEPRPAEAGRRRAERELANHEVHFDARVFGRQGPRFRELAAGSFRDYPAVTP